MMRASVFRPSPLLLLTAALVALAVLFTPGGQSAQAQTTTVLVGNIGQADTGLHYDTNAFSVAQAFTSGSFSAGYTLESIDISMTASNITQAQRNSIRVELWSAATGGAPGAKLYDLTVPAHPISAGTVSFAAPIGTTLRASTTYYAVFYTVGGFNMELGNTASDNEDSGAAMGWSIANGARNVQVDEPTSTSAWSAEGSDSLRINVNGSINSPDGTTEYWSDTLSVKAVDYGFGCGYRTGQPNCSAALGLNVITYHRNAYIVELIHVAYGDTLQFILSEDPVDSDGTRTERARMALYVGDRQFLVKDAQVSYGIAENNVWTNEDAWVLTWTNSGLSWSEGDSVSLSVVTLPVGGL